MRVAASLVFSEAEGCTAFVAPAEATPSVAADAVAGDAQVKVPKYNGSRKPLCLFIGAPAAGTARTMRRKGFDTFNVKVQTSSSVIQEKEFQQVTGMIKAGLFDFVYIKVPEAAGLQRTCRRKLWKTFNLAKLFLARRSGKNF